MGSRSASAAAPGEVRSLVVFGVATPSDLVFSGSAGTTTSGRFDRIDEDTRELRKWTTAVRYWVMLREPSVTCAKTYGQAGCTSSPPGMCASLEHANQKCHFDGLVAADYSSLHA